MLRRYDIARFALQHSPEKEQRLIAFASDANTAGSSEEENPKDTVGFTEYFLGGGTQESVEAEDFCQRRIENIISETRAELTFLHDLALLDTKKAEEDPNGAINRFFERHHDAVSDFYSKRHGVDFRYEDWSMEVISDLRQGLAKEIREVISRVRHKYGPQSNAYLSHKDFCNHFLQSLGNNEKSAAEKAEYERGEKEVPNAFFDVKDQRVVFDLSAEEFNVEKTLERMERTNPDATREEAEESVMKQRERAIVHELAHYSLDWKNKADAEPLGKNMLVQLRNALKVKKLEDSATWKKLERAVFHAFDTAGVGWSEEDILHEGLAVLVAGKKWPYEETHRVFDVTIAMKQLLEEAKDTPSVKVLVDQLGKDLAFMIAGTEQFGSSFDAIQKTMKMSDDEREENALFEEKFREHNIDADVKNVRTNNPEAHDDIEKEIDEKAEEISTDPRKILNAINEASIAFDTVKRLAPDCITRMSPDKQAAEKIGFEKMIESLSRDMNDLGAVERDAKLFEQWEENPVSLSIEDKNYLSKKYNFEDIGKYDASMNKSSVTFLDAKNKKKRAEVIVDLAKAVATHFEPMTKMAKMLEEEQEKATASSSSKEQAKNIGFMGKMEQLFGKKAGVHWLSVFDMIKIYNIYKDAILERYQSKQKIRIYDAAKDWNMYSPLQPDLDKQAKSANDEETTKFKEYLVKDGFTYDDLFRGGGVLDKNRSNINRAKAVIDYAADHAWLYELNRDDGSNVYGLDYEGLWGKQTFEELVEANAKAQDSEKSKGRSKVNNDPDIPLLVKEIKGELEKKNIWSVLGIVERLQEKAKYAESNTWALVAIIKTLQNDKDGTLQKVFAAGGKGMMDAVGGLGIGQSAWSLTLFKTQRHALAEWIKEGCTEEGAKRIGAKWAKKGYIKEHSFIPEVINHIERELYENPDAIESAGDDGVWHKTAKVLSTQVVVAESGKSVSVFDDNLVYNGYRDYWRATQTTTKAKDTDDDFFNPNNGGADIVLLWGDGIGSILECTSLGQFSNEGKARGYLTQLLVLHDKLKKNNSEAYGNFLRETKQKLDVWLRKSANNQNTRKTFGTYDTTTMAGSPAHSEKNILAELWKRDLINEEMLRAYVEGFDSDKSVPVLLKPLRKAIQEEKATEKGTPQEKQAAKAKVRQKLENMKIMGA